MRYLGSKIKLLEQIENVINDNHIEGETFADLFAGTGCVGDYFKDRYKVISNDFLYYSFVLITHYVWIDGTLIPSVRSYVSDEDQFYQDMERCFLIGYPQGEREPSLEEI